MMLFGKKEDEVTTLMEEHAKCVQKCLDYFVDGLEAYIDDDKCTCNDIREKIVKNEHKADDYRREVQMKLYEGAFMPLFRDDVYMFIDKFDNIADESKHLMDGFVLEKPKIPKDLSDDLYELLKSSVSPYSELKNALKVFRNDKKEALAATLEIEKKEQKVDRMEHDLRKRIFDHKKLSLAEKLHLRTYTLHIAKISDIIEDCSDLIEMMLVKRQL